MLVVEMIKAVKDLFCVVPDEGFFEGSELSDYVGQTSLHLF